MRLVPRTKLWRQGDGFVIVLECACGAALYYPGHPDERESVECESCGTIWTISTEGDPDLAPPRNRA